MTPQTTISIGNRWLTRTYALDGERLLGSSVYNRLAGTTVGCGADEFRLEIGDRAVTAADCRVLAVDGPAPDRQDGAEAVALRLAVDGLPVEIGLRVWAPPRQPWLHKQLTVVNRGDGPLTLYTAAEEWLTIGGERLTYAVEEAETEQPRVVRAFHEAIGQPVFTESLFWGLEFPHSLSGRAPSGELQLRHFPGRVLAAGERWESKRAVVGAARTGQVDDAFDQYCLSLRPFADPYRVVNWLCCWLAIAPTYAEGRELLPFLKRRLVDELGAPLDAFDLSAMTWALRLPDGYENEGLWQPRERDVHERMAADCRAAGIPYGMYCCVNGFLPFANTREWGEAQEFGLAADTAYCLAEPRYRAAITECILDCARRYDLGEVTFDMVWQKNGLGCQTAGHGHVVDPQRDPHGRFGTEAFVEAHLALYAGLRAINPAIIISVMTYDCWGSPWWLSAVDVIHAVDGDTPASHVALSPRFRDHLIAARDEQLYDMYRARRCKLPMWGNDSFLGLQVRREFISQGYALNADEPTEQWEDELIMGTAGHLHAAFLNCVDHRLLDETPSGLAFYADVLKWTKAHRWTLFDTRMILGDPRAGEPVGYAHRGEDETILCLRNNAMATKSAEISLTADLLPFGGTTGAFVATQLYPVGLELADGLRTGGTLRVELPPHQAQVVRLQAEAALAEPRVIGARYRLRSAAPGSVEVELWGMPGTSADVAIQSMATGPAEQTRVTFPGASAGTITWRVDGPNATADGYSAEIAVEVGEGIRGQLHLCVDDGIDREEPLPFGDGTPGWPRMSLAEWLARLNERDRSGGSGIGLENLPSVVVEHRLADGTTAGSARPHEAATGSIHWRPRTHPSLAHSWYLVDLGPGANRVQLHLPAAPQPSRLGVWLESWTPLAGQTLTISVPAGYMLPPQLPSLHPNEARQVIEVLPFQSLADDSRG